MTAARDDIEYWKPVLIDAFGMMLDTIFDNQTRLGDLDRAALSRSARLEGLIGADVRDRDTEMRRREAEAAAAEGHFANLDDTVVRPTREWIEKAPVLPYTPSSRDGAAKSVSTVRRIVTDELVVLHNRGVIDHMQFSACLWFRERHEAAQLSSNAAVASYGETIRGDMIYGHLPSSEWAAEARMDWLWACGFIPKMVEPVFNAIVLEHMTLTGAARKIGRRREYARAAFQLAANYLYDGIKARIQLLKN